jgi:hypothetical protein
MRAPATGSKGHVEHSKLVGALSYGFLLQYWPLQLFALSGIPNDVPRRKRFAAVYRHQPWPAFTALLFLAGATVCQILYYV